VFSTARCALISAPWPPTPIYASDDLDALDVLRGIVRSGLLGWTPNSADITAAPFEFRSGALSSEMNEQTADIVWWVDIYATTYLTRAV